MLSQDQIKNKVRTSFLNGTYSEDEETQYLVSQGIEEKTARYLVVNAYEQSRNELSQKKESTQTNSELQQILQGVIIGAAILGPLFNIRSTFWYLAAAAIAANAGYFGYKDKPYAGAAAGIVMVIAFPFAYSFYFSGRSSFIKIEFLIPLLIAAAPAFLVLIIISKLFYSDSNN